MTPALQSPPKYWKYEQNAALAVAVQHYQTAESLTPQDVEMIARYLKQWIECPAWERIAGIKSRLRKRKHKRLDTLHYLRITVRRIHSRRDIEDWHREAVDLGINPF